MNIDLLTPSLNAALQGPLTPNAPSAALQDSYRASQAAAAETLAPVAPPEAVAAPSAMEALQYQIHSAHSQINAQLFSKIAKPVVDGIKQLISAQ